MIRADGYNGCFQRDEIGVFEDRMTADQCAKACADDPLCVSAEMQVSRRRTFPDPNSSEKLERCALSSTCTNFRAEKENRKDTTVNSFWYKSATSNVPGYNVNHKVNNSCLKRNELGAYRSSKTLKECVEMCDSDSECVSAEIRELDGGKVNLRDTRNVALCHLSSTCDNAQASSEKTDNAGWYLYHKV